VLKPNKHIQYTQVLIICQSKKLTNFSAKNGNITQDIPDVTIASISATRADTGQPFIKKYIQPKKNVITGDTSCVGLTTFFAATAPQLGQLSAVS
jgi:hypothetical protein